MATLIDLAASGLRQRQLGVDFPRSPALKAIFRKISRAATIQVAVRYQWWNKANGASSSVQVLASL
jgi:hypothetical protein